MDEQQFQPLPNSAEAERAILGAILLYNALMDQAVLQLKPDYFYTPSHRLIYSAMLELYDTFSEINPVLVGEILKRDKNLARVGGVSSITNLTYGLPHSTNIAHYAAVLKTKWEYRWAAKEGERITRQALDEDGSPNEIFTTAVDRFSNQQEQSVGGTSGGEGAELRQLYEDHLYLVKAGVNPSISTGFDHLDHMTGGGIAPGEVWGIGALSSQGKTSLLLQILRSMAKRKVPCVLFSLEMGARLIALRIGTAESDVSMKAIHPRMPHGQIDYLLSKAKLAFESVPAVYTDCRSIGQIRARIQAVKRRHQVKVIGIDYYGLISGYGAGRDRYENRTQELKYIATALQQQIAIDEGVGVIVPAQFNRSAWAAKEPGPASIDGGEAFYQACDLFATLETKPAKDGEKETKASLNVQKHRNGPTGKIGLLFNRERMEFRVPPQDEGDVDETETEERFGRGAND